MSRYLKQHVLFFSTSLCVVALTAGSLSAQGDTGFLRGKAKLDLSFSYTLDTYDHFWMGDHRVKDPGVGRVTRAGYSLWGAYGLLDELDLVAAGSWVVASTDGDAPFDRNDDFQDAVLGVKYRLLSAPVDSSEFSLLVAPSVKFPLANYEEDDVTAIGDGQTDYRGRIIGHFQLPSGMFVSLETGYDKRSGLPDDEVPVHLTAGITVLNSLTLTPYYSNVNSLDGIDIGEGPFPATEEDYERVGIGAYLRVADRIGVTGNVRTTVDGKNTGDVGGFSLGFVVSL
ncbi:MAG: transporter [Planctomycetota bacterium]